MYIGGGAGKLVHDREKVISVLCFPRLIESSLVYIFISLRTSEPVPVCSCVLYKIALVILGPLFYNFFCLVYDINSSGNVR